LSELIQNFKYEIKIQMDLYTFNSVINSVNPPKKNSDGCVSDRSQVKSDCQGTKSAQTDLDGKYNVPKAEMFYSFLCRNDRQNSGSRALLPLM
jgi:hypothetical protein